MSTGYVKFYKNPSRSVLEENWKLSGYRIFYDPCWVDSLMSDTQVPICFSSNSNENGNILSIAVHEDGPIGGSLWFPTLPIFFQRESEFVDIFWTTVTRYVRCHFVSVLKILSYDSSPIDIPMLFRNSNISFREEFIWDLLDAEKLNLSVLSKNHQRNIKKGDKNKLVLMFGRDSDFINSHSEMCQHSELRRSGAKEITQNTANNTKRSQKFIESGHGQIWQAIFGGEVASSVLLLGRGPRRYYHSSGTSAAGQKIGASQWLIWNIAQKLQERGVKWFNLAGVSEGQTGLRRYKGGFSAHSLKLSHYQFYPFGNSIILKAVMKLFRFSSPLYRELFKQQNSFRSDGS